MNQTTKLRNAIESDNLNEIKRLIEVEKCDINELDNCGKLLLEYTLSRYRCFSKTLSTIDYLFENGANVNTVTHYNETIIHVAINNVCNDSDIPIIEYFLKKGASIETINSALMYTVKNTETYHNHIHQLIRLLIKYGADINYIDCIDKNSANKRTILMEYCMRYENSLSVVEILVNNGANIHAVDTYGINILTICASLGKDDYVKYFAEYGVNVNNISDNINDSISYSNHDNCLINIYNSIDRLTPLLIAVQKCSYESIKLLIDCGADVNFVSGDVSVLMMACAQNPKFEIIELLVKNNANVNFRNEIGLTPYMILMFKKEYKIAEYIKEIANKDTNMVYITKFTPKRKSTDKVCDNKRIKR